MRRLLSASLLLAVAFGCGPQQDTDDDGGTVVADSGSTGGGAGGGTGGGAGGGSTGVRRITALSLSPTSLSLAVGQISGITATATFDDGSSADVSGTVQWQTSASGVVDVSLLSAEDNLVKVQAIAVGTVTVTAKTGAIASNACTITVTAAQTDGGTGTGALKEVRALWVTRFAYNTQAHVQTIINDAASAGFNVIYFQIRGNGDAYYQSSLVPWATKLTGTLGQDPGWDPLQTAITAAHAKGMQLHAYFNVFSGWPTPSGCSGAGTCACTPVAASGVTDPCTLPPASPSGKPTHVLRDHPEWMAVTSNGKSIDSEYYWISPAAAGYRTHLVEVMNELLTNYDVDGVHLDRIRYPGSSYSYDPESNAAYDALPSPKPSRADWQRTLVNDAVNSIYGAVKQKRPKAVLSASVWGIYKVLTGCSTSQGFANYYQDSIGWMKAGYIDALTPMIYWDIGTGCTDWSKHLDVFMAGANGRHIVAGMHAQDNNPQGGSDIVRPERIKARIQYARQVGAAGTSIFASSYFNSTHYATFRGDGGVYAVDAGWPEITWRDAGQ